MAGRWERNGSEVRAEKREGYRNETSSISHSAGLGVAAAAIAAPAIAQSMPEIKWRMTSSFPKSLDTIYGARRDFRQGGGGSDRQQIPDPGLRRRRNRARACRRRMPCRTALSRCATPLPTIMSARIRPLPSAPPVPFGLNSRMQTAWLYFGGGMELMNELLQEVQRLRAFLAGNTGCQMGGWFRKEIKDRRRPQRPEDAHRRLRRPGAGEARRGAAADRRRRNLSGAGKGHIDAPNGSVPMTTRSSASSKVAQYYYLPGLVGRRRDAAQLHQHREVERAAASLQVDRQDGIGTMPMPGCMANYDALNPPALKRLLAGGAQLRPFPPAVMDAC